MRRAFTLVELLVVITVMAILAGLVLTGISRIRLAARVADTTARMRQVSDGLRVYAADHGFTTLMRWGLYQGGTRGGQAYCGTVQTSTAAMNAIWNSAAASVGTAMWDTNYDLYSLRFSNQTQHATQPWEFTYIHFEWNGDGYWSRSPLFRSGFNPMKTVELLAISGVMECDDDPATAIDERDPGTLPAGTDYTFTDGYPEQSAAELTAAAERMRPYLAKYVFVHGKRWPWNDAWGNPMVVGYTFKNAFNNGRGGNVGQRMMFCVGSLGEVPAGVDLTGDGLQTVSTLLVQQWNFDTMAVTYPADIEAARSAWITGDGFRDLVSTGKLMIPLRRAWFTISQVTRAGEPWTENGSMPNLDPIIQPTSGTPYPKGPFTPVGKRFGATCMMGDILRLAQ